MMPLIQRAFDKSKNGNKIVCFLALVTTMVTKVDHGNHRSKDRGNHHSNHRSNYRGFYDGNACFLHLLPRILPYLMTIGCEMYYHHSNHCSNHDGYYDGYHNHYDDGYHDQPWLPS